MNRGFHVQSTLRRHVICDRNPNRLIRLNPKSELFYQRVLESYLGHGHKKLQVGETDVTTFDLHAEIKKWPNWKQAMGQLIAYNTEDPKERIQLYLFGDYRKKTIATKVLQQNGIDVYEFHLTPGSCDIYDMALKETVFRQFL